MTKEELIDRINDIEWEDFEAKEAKSELNMLSHFDPFSTIHSCIHIYTDRVEFFNAGGYPVPISQLGNHLYSNPRNPIIAKIFRLVKLSETIGYGFDIMNEWKEITGNDVTFESDQSSIHS